MTNINKEDKKQIIEDFLQYCFLEHNTTLMYFDEELSCEYRQPVYEHADDVKLLEGYLSE